jgi:hypothetical protein
MALNLMMELGPSNPIYPFMLLSQYRLLVCQKCQHACLAREVASHLAKRHPGIDPTVCSRGGNSTKYNKKCRTWSVHVVLANKFIFDQIDSLLSGRVGPQVLYLESITWSICVITKTSSV